ncbi:pro-neuregulin-1, membrane-bound isoform isoform X12 [Pangasianodon hypophthalmus]|uniref:pro-neuregulin-1, membrane-bound isoform isoform X12 n=1 Tax=Pangasianodon hypophthalmus TaxID=310915 RepID=UPI000EFF01C9|nr:pro-neuregulin-1, membrane-bound isoform isoform X12 [Pangasianodon hypophthalmus]
MAAAGVEDSSDRLGAPESSTSPVDPSSEDLSEAGPEEALEEVKLEEEKLEEAEVVVEENGEEHRLLGCLGLTAASCCVCVELEQVRSCVRSEKICILPILACLLSLALCTAGLKWVFVDKIFEYEPPTHLDPKPIGQDPIIIDADPTMGLPMSFSQPTSTRTHLPATTAKIPAHPEVFVEDDSTAGPFAPASPKVTHFLPPSRVTTHLNPASQPTPRTTAVPGRNNTPSQHESNNIVTKTSPTSTTASAKTSSHMTRCKEEEKSYCVNGGECLTVNVTPNSTKHLCRCPNEFTGDRCQTYVMASFYKHHGIEFMEAEELYQKRILTITGICIALLVVGIMCVVAYCKTKKQRQKLHDRLRQSLRKRNAMADIGNGPQYPQNFQQPPQSLQLVNQYASKNTVPAQHVIEKETETSFTLSQYTSPTQPSTAITANLSQCWSNKKPENVVSDSRVISGVQNSRNGTPSHRGRLNATGGVRDVNACVKTSRETTDSYKDSPYSERYVSTVTTPTRLSPVKSLSPATPSSPPSEVSAPLPSLATSIPSMAMSPSGEEERPLLFLTPPRLREKSEPSRAQQLRNSAHYNHGLDEMSPPPSPLHIQEDEQHESMQEDSSVPCAPPTSAPHSPTAMHNSKRTKAGSQNSQDEQSGSSSESSSSESEAEEERMAEDTPFLIQNAGVASMAMLGLELVDSSRTNAALRLSPQDDLQSRLASVMANQDPIAV